MRIASEQRRLWMTLMTSSKLISLIQQLLEVAADQCSDAPRQHDDVPVANFATAETTVLASSAFRKQDSRHGIIIPLRGNVCGAILTAFNKRLMFPLAT